jgi:hypothetical protein
MNNEAFARKRLVECCHMLYDRNLTVSAGGNMSVRLNDGEILITPSGVNKGLVREDDLVKMDMDGNVLSGGKPSIEHKFHLGIYRENPETNAVVHCHPLYCLAVLTRGEDLKSTLTPEGVLLLDQVPTCRYATPGSDELVDAVMEYARAPAMLMAVASGTVDFVCTDMPTAQGALIAYPDLVLLDFAGSGNDFEVSEEEINIGVSVKKGNTALVDAINAYLKDKTADDFNALMAEAIKIQPLSE